MMEAYPVVGIDLGGTNVRAAQVSLQGEGVGEDGLRLGPVYRCSTPPKERGFEAVLEVLLHVYRQAAGDASIAAVGVGIPGTTQADSRCSWAPNLGWTDAPLERSLAQKLGLPVRCENDANAAALAESRLGAGVGWASMLMLTLGTGVGSGWVLNGRLHTGAHGWAGELGHMTLEMDGLQCNCGRRGCFERYASARALGEQGVVAAIEHPGSLLASRGHHNVDGGWVAQCAQQGDVTARRVWLRYVEYLAGGIASACSMMDPDCVVLGGGVAAAGEALLIPLQKRLERTRLSAHTPLPTLAVARCGDEAGVLGAALCAWDSFGKCAQK